MYIYAIFEKTKCQKKFGGKFFVLL